MSNRIRPRVYFFRNGVEQTSHPMNGRPVESFGIPTGTVGKASCFRSITVRDTRDVELTEIDFDGPTSIKVWSPDSPAQWFGLASVDTVRKALQERKRGQSVAC